MTPLVTGATGFLGLWITRALSAAGCRPIVLVRDVGRLAPLKGLDIDVVRGDILDPASLGPAMDKATCVVHVAGFVGLRQRDKAQLFRVNVEGTRNVLDAAATRRLRVVHTSSIATVGLTRRALALDESAFGRHEVQLEYPYLQSKQASEELALSRARRGDDVVVVLPGNLLGPGDVNRTSTRFVRGYLGGTLRFYLSGGISFGDVRDVANACVSALRSGRSGERYILAGINYSYADLLRLLWELTDLYPPNPAPWPMAELFATWSAMLSAYVRHPLEEINPAVVEYGKYFNFCDSAKAAAELGYRFRPFADTLRDTIAEALIQREVPATTPKLQRILTSAALSPSRSPSA